MKKILAFIFLTFNYVFVSAQYITKIDLDLPSKLISYNNIIREEIYEIKVKSSGKTDSTLIGSSDYNYDGLKKIISQAICVKDPQVKLTINYSYYSNNYLKKASTKFPDINYSKMLNASGFPSFNNTEYEYDKNGNVTTILNFDDDTSRLYITRKEYNDSGKLVKVSTQYNKQGIRLAKTFVYDAIGSLLKEVNYASNGTIIFSKQYSYNKSEKIYDNFQKKGR